jgi:hypothetical protein
MSCLITAAVEEIGPMSGLAFRFVLFCALTFATSAFMAVPYLTIH